MYKSYEMVKILNFLKFFIILSVFSTFFFVFLALFILWKYSPELPSYTELKNYNPSLTTRVFTSDGLLLDKYYVEERLFVPIERIPDTLINAFLSAEDKKFYYHFGIDPLAILRASITNILNTFNNKRIIGRIIVPKLSICLIGFKVTRPNFLAVLSPNFIAK